MRYYAEEDMPQEWHSKVAPQKGTSLSIHEFLAVLTCTFSAALLFSLLQPVANTMNLDKEFEQDDRKLGGITT
jgi:hypothetical protein